MSTLQKSLKQSMRAGNLTVADLSRWFAVPYPTMRTWVKQGRQPRGGPNECARIDRLGANLNKVIRTRKEFPLGRMPDRERIVLMNRLKKNGAAR